MRSTYPWHGRRGITGVYRCISKEFFGQSIFPQQNQQGLNIERKSAEDPHSRHTRCMQLMASVV